MEVISGASAVLQVVATSATLIAKTAVFIQNAKQVNETTNNLFNQVTTLQSTVQVVHTVLKGWQTNLGDGPLGHEEAEALAKMKTTLRPGSSPLVAGNQNQNG
jgi:argininosuccinate lyase